MNPESVVENRFQRRDHRVAGFAVANALTGLGLMWMLRREEPAKPEPDARAGLRPCNRNRAVTTRRGAGIARGAIRKNFPRIVTPVGPKLRKACGNLRRSTH